MKKCGLATITVGANYGNKLQNYALQQVVRSFGFQPETIRYQPIYPYNSIVAKILRKLKEWRSYNIIAVLFDMKRIIEKRLCKMLHPNVEKNRMDNFSEFVQTEIKMGSHEYCFNDDLSMLNDQYDVFITGSDQVWNPYWEGVNPFYFLTFADKRKRIAYAPSFGVEDIPKDLKDYYQSNLSPIPYLSTREEQGQEIIQSLIHRKIPVLIDPCFLLGHKAWLEIAKKAICRPAQEYLLCYFLGVKSHEHHKAIVRFAKKNNLTIVSLNDVTNPKGYVCGPAEFLDLIANAKAVCTDSFHGTVFSIIFNRPFITFIRSCSNKRESMNSRIDTLLNSFGLQDCLFQSDLTWENVLQINFNKTNCILEDKRKFALSYLSDALNNINNDIIGENY
ncbi:polysaccharide pyruvyl transferase family protein [Caproiciproducens faecalis]|uniref:Polysaccharide pyruvyl transferase family protein n=1 Tax=Caproiciproducens faecalis TaxID=2820301 RepID=A0ABS7DN70_9FIRM|nr:polysaccharide pyruvyl transferase family protein [Caproiciproducens faecalis]MBW7571981.1 polysaccharide pyruvyl transferase family protein [Caproiciproducens faecalis]